MINDKKREFQLDVVEAFEKNDFNGFGFVPTGVGKAWVFIEILRRLNPKTVWYLCDSELNRDVTFKEELKKWGGEKWLDRINFMCYQTAYKLEGESVEVILADEADFSMTPQYSKVYHNNNVKHKILLSGTMAGKKIKMLEKIVPIVYNLEIKDAEKHGILNKTKSYLVNYLLTPAENKRYLGYNKRFKILLYGSKDRIALEQLQLARKRFLSNLTSSLNICRKLLRHLYKDENNKILIFCGLSEQADSVCKYSFHSKNNSEYLDAFDRDEIRIVSVVGKADRGLNLNGVNVIVFESPTSSSTKFKQRSGRGRRLHVDDILTMYFLVPYYRDNRGKIRPTIVNDWVYKAAHKMNFSPKVFKFNE